MKRWFFVILVVFSLLFTAGCYQAPAPADLGSVGNTKIIAPIDYGNGVYHFPITGAEFGNSLSNFIKDHPKLQFAGMEGDGQGVYGAPRGYFVVFIPK